MKLGMVGLGKMGGNMVTRLLNDGHEVVVTDLSQEAIQISVDEGATGAENLGDLISKLSAPRAVWLMVPAGKPTEGLVQEALEHLSSGDILIDGANSNWEDSTRRASLAQEKGVHYVDAGVSGGVWGLKEGFNIMVGGSDEAFKQIEPILKTLAPENGYANVGPAGTGHFVKMVHNGIEYGLMQAYGEGFETLASFEGHKIDLHQVSELWLHGSVIRSWLLDLAENAFEKDARLEEIRGYVSDSGMGRWMLEYGIDHAVPMPAIAAALFARFESRQEDSFAAKLSAALRNEFGGHAVKKED